MIKGISYWAFSGGGEGKLPIEEAAKEAKAAGFQALEPAIGLQGVLTPQTPRQECERIRQAVEKNGLVMQTLASGMTWGCCPTDPDPAVRAKSIELHREALHRAAWLGCQAMLFVPGAIKILWNPSFGPVPYEEAYLWAKAAIADLSRTATEVGVDLCVENVWNGLFYSPLEFAALLDAFPNSRVGAYFDAGNVLGYHQYPPHWIKILGQRIKRLHIKDFKCAVGNLGGFCDLMVGDMPWKETMAALRAIGYDGTVIAEVGPPDEGLLARTSQAMDKIFSL